MRAKPVHAPSGFFVVRTPLLPAEELEAFGAGLEAPGARPDDLETALARDAATLRGRLQALLERPEVREALFVASPSAYGALAEWRRDPESEPGQKAERTLVRYLERMAARSTPFGLFAGGSVGDLGDATELVLAPRERYRRHTRLDGDYLDGLCRALLADRAVREALTYRPNSGAYLAAGRLRYAESRLADRDRSYHLVAADHDAPLKLVLERARDGATPAELRAALLASDPELAAEDVESYVEELVGSQILVPELSPMVTGREPLADLVDQLQRLPSCRQAAAVLTEVGATLAALDERGVGNDVESYRAVAARLEALPAKVELPRLFQVDMVKPAPGATLGRGVAAELLRGLETLRRFGAAREPEDLKSFREAFRGRYEDREVPLVEALDDEHGIGFGGGVEATPLLDGIGLPGPAPDPRAPAGAREAHLLWRISGALARGEREVVLGDADVEALAVAEPAPLPDAFAAMFALEAASGEALARGEYRIHLSSAGGPSGAVLLGRFCHGDAELHRRVVEHVRAEEALRPDAAFAEIVHLPEGRIGNIMFRPALRDWEIPYLGRSGAPPERQLPVTDLLVSLDGPRVVLRSRRLGREIVPRLTSAHNYRLRSLPLYRFLCVLQGSGGAALDLGPLRAFERLPRLVLGRFVLSRARWRITRPHLERLGERARAGRFRAVQALRAALELPRHVALVDADNVLWVDLDNVLSVETFVHLVKGRGEALLEEAGAAAGGLVVQGPEGRFHHELIVPFVRSGAPAEARSRPARPEEAEERSFAPGSPWLYAKLYAGGSTVDRLLVDLAAPLLRQALASGAADRWFFVRYGDPDWHLRLRLRGRAERLAAEILPALHHACRPLLETGALRKLQLDTYDRELERYGGGLGMELSERLFCADSEAVLGIVELLAGDAGLDARWRLTVRGMDRLLDDLGLPLEERLELVRRVAASFAREHRADKRTEETLSARFRRERSALEALLDPARDAGSELEPGFELFAERSRRLAPIAAELRQAQAQGRLTVPLADLASSYLHMHANRLLRGAARAQELVIYQFLVRLYESQLARRKRGR